MCPFSTATIANGARQQNGDLVCGFACLQSRCVGLMLAVGRTFGQTQAAAASGFLCSRVFSFLDARAYFTRPWIDIVQSYLPFERERERASVRASAGSNVSLAFIVCNAFE